MGDLIAKMTASKKSKIISCFIIALPIWAIITFVDLTPPVETSVVVTETQSQTQSQVTEETKIDYLADLVVSETDDGYYTSNKYFGIGIYNVDKKDVDVTSEQFTSDVESNMIAIYKSNFNLFSKSDDIKLTHTSTNTETINDKKVTADEGTANTYAFKNIYVENDESIQIVTILITDASNEQLHKEIYNHTKTIETKHNTLTNEEIKQILKVKE